MPVEGKVHWAVTGTEVVDGEIHATVEMRVGAPVSPVFATVTLVLRKNLTPEDQRNAIRDSCYLALRKFREKERAEGDIVTLPKQGTEDFT